MAEQEGTIFVQVCYATPESRFLQDLTVATGTTLAQAIDASGVLVQIPEIDLATCKTGIYGKLKPLETLLHERDRIEIYRPLTADPKDARRTRTRRQGNKKTG